MTSVIVLSCALTVKDSCLCVAAGEVAEATTAASWTGTGTNVCVENAEQFVLGILSDVVFSAGI